ncbi:MAG: multiprotein bridging factor aMBF1 [Candidatus Baldrarchaeia archaeon]
MRCEICGRKIQGTPRYIFVEGAKLVVCQICAKFGSEIPTPQIPRKTLTKKAIKTPKRPIRKETRRVSRLTFFEEEYELVENFGEKVKKAREKLGWKQEDLAREIKERESIIRKIETMEMIPSFNIIKKLEKALNIKLIVPISKVPETSPPPPKETPLTLGDAIVLKKKKSKR